MTVWTRRRFVAAGSAASLLLPAMARADALLALPAQTEGPFYPDALPPDIDNDLVKIAGQMREAGGKILGLSGRVIDRGGAPVTGAIVEIWQADVNGSYIHSRGQGRGRDRDPYFQGFGRYEVAGNGEYDFRTIVPVAYSGRCPHIHVKIRDPRGGTLTSQIYIAGDPHNDADGIYRRLSDAERQASSMAILPSGGGGTDVTARFDMVVG